MTSINYRLYFPDSAYAAPPEPYPGGMSLWMYFADEWQAIVDAENLLPPPYDPHFVPPPDPRSHTGSGGRNYDRLPLDYWETRQEYLAGGAVLPPNTGLLQPSPKPQAVAWAHPNVPPRRPPPPPPKPVFTDEQRGAHLSAMKGASSLDELKSLSGRLRRYSA